MKQKMKHLQSLVAVALCVIFAMSFTSCSKDNDEPDNKTLYGVWAKIKAPDSFPLLITKDCMVMDDSDGGPALLVPYLNASYETLENRFAPDDEFFVYRYDSKNDMYILYSGDDEDENGNILFDTNDPLLILFDTNDPLLLRATFSTISNEIMEGQCQWPEFDYDGLVTREELLSNSKYASVPSNVKIDFDEVRTYYKVK